MEHSCQLNNKPGTAASQLMYFIYKVHYDVLLGDIPGKDGQANTFYSENARKDEHDRMALLHSLRSGLK